MWPKAGTEIYRCKRAGEGGGGRDARGPAGLPRSPRSPAEASLSPRPSARAPLLEGTAPAKNWGWYFPKLACKDVGDMMAGPQGRAGSPWCTKPAARPGLAKGVTAAPRVAGQPNDGTTSKPQSRSGSLRRPGRRLQARCAAPGVPLPRQAGQPRSRERRDSPGPECLSRRTRPSAPRGFARATHPPLPTKGLWEM